MSCHAYFCDRVYSYHHMAVSGNGENDLFPRRSHNTHVAIPIEPMHPREPKAKDFWLSVY